MTYDPWIIVLDNVAWILALLASFGLVYWSFRYRRLYLIIPILAQLIYTYVQFRWVTSGFEDSPLLEAIWAGMETIRTLALIDLVRRLEESFRELRNRPRSVVELPKVTCDLAKDKEKTKKALDDFLKNLRK